MVDLTPDNNISLNLVMERDFMANDWDIQCDTDLYPWWPGRSALSAMYDMTTRILVDLERDTK